MVWKAAVATLVVLASLAGCSDGGKGAGGGGDVEGATLRGVVVDSAIRPLADASVVATGGGLVLNATTGADGLFAFDGLQPGVFVLVVSKPFYVAQQVTAQVASGDAEPPALKVELQLESGTLPFANLVKWDGFLECSATIGNWCGIANLYPCIVQSQAGQQCTRVSNDQSFNFLTGFFTDLQRIPDWLQMEAAGESTQSFSSSMAIRFAATNQSEWDQFSYGPVLANVHGPSPLIASVPGLGVAEGDDYLANQTVLEESEIGLTRGMTTELFHGAPDAAPGELEQCTPDSPIGKGCWSNQFLGVAANQRITILYMAFYGYRPPPGWTYTAEGEMPPPPT
jgi:hypothetical protein